MRPGSGPSRWPRTAALSPEFPSEPLSLSFLPDRRRPVRVAGTTVEVRGSRRGASSKAGSSPPNRHLQGRKAWGSPSSPGRGQPSLPPGRAQLGSPPPAPSAGHPPVRSSPWSPASRDGRGPGGHRPANAGSEGESAPLPLRQPRPTCEGMRGSWTAAAGRGRAPRRPEPLPGTPSTPGGAGRGETPGGCRGPARPVARVAGTWLSP